MDSRIKSAYRILLIGGDPIAVVAECERVLHTRKPAGKSPAEWIAYLKAECARILQRPEKDFESDARLLRDLVAHERADAQRRKLDADLASAREMLAGAESRCAAEVAAVRQRHADKIGDARRAVLGIESDRRNVQATLEELNPGARAWQELGTAAANT